MYTRAHVRARARSYTHSHTQKYTRTHTYKHKYTHAESYPSHALMVQLAMIHKVSIKTRRTVPGQIVIKVLSTKRVLKLIRLRAPMDRDEASVKSLLWSNITRQIRYNRRNIGKEKTRSKGTSSAVEVTPSDLTVVHVKRKVRGSG